jgi:uncharacterized protein YbjT (DUF2867 family)
MSGKTALLFGATGLVGGEVLKRILQDPAYEKIKIFVRHRPGVNSEKIEVYMADFNNWSRFEHMISGDDLFCCLGTTIKKAGTKEAFRKIDLEVPAKLAEIASKNGVINFFVISSIGADDKSSNLYLRTKGEMELAVKKYKFQQLAIFRPSLLLGERREFRIGETAGKVIMKLAHPFLLGNLKRYRPIKAATVAKAMIAIASGRNEDRVYESDEIELIGN